MAAERYDLLISGGMLIDGSGAPRRPADMAIRDARIAVIAAPGAFARAEAATRIDATGRIVAPGFIDTHTHDDRALLAAPEMTPKVSQGVTTVVSGNCGISLAPLAGASAVPPPLTLIGEPGDYRYAGFAQYVAALEEARPAVNVAPLIGHMTLRVGAMGALDRAANAGEIDAMRARLDAGLAAGAVGFSTGLYYKPNSAADMDEVVALAEVAAAHGGVFCTHMRDEHDGVAESLEETFVAAARARVSVVISHHKCAGPENWGRSRETLALIEAARARQRVALDAYPYRAGSTVLDPDYIDERIDTLISSSEPHPELAGRALGDIASEWGVSHREAARRLAPASAIYFQMDEADVRRILAYPPTMIGSDGLPHDTRPHPRLWGTFPRVLGHYCREEGLFTLEEAVRKMTGAPAATFGLSGRGVLGPGAYADIVVFDAETVIDRATFEDPCQTAAGIDWVVVNGTPVWRNGEATRARPGRLVERA